MHQISYIILSNLFCRSNREGNELLRTGTPHSYKKFHVGYDQAHCMFFLRPFLPPRVIFLLFLGGTSSWLGRQPSRGPLPSTDCSQASCRLLARLFLNRRAPWRRFPFLNFSTMLGLGSTSLGRRLWSGVPQTRFRKSSRSPRGPWWSASGWGRSLGIPWLQGRTSSASATAGSWGRPCRTASSRLRQRASVQS